MGLNVTCPTSVVDIGELPPPPTSLGECLQTAASQRRELDVARTNVQITQEGTKAAKADFYRDVAEGDYFNASRRPRGRIWGWDWLSSNWNGPCSRRSACRRTAGRRLQNARHRPRQFHRRHDQFLRRSRPIGSRSAPFRGDWPGKAAVTQSRENYRLIKARMAQGDATATELTDAETALTRPEQDFLNSTYEYLTARARLDYAIGQTAGPSSR